MYPATARFSPVQPPRLELRTDGQVLVTRWGQVGTLILRPGDRILPGPSTGPVVLLLARGIGRPMLAVRDGRRLLALPGLVPVSLERWTVAFAVQGVERDVERGGPGIDGLYLAANDGAGGSVARSPGPVDSATVEGECLRAAVGARRGRSPSLALATSADAAALLLAGATPGTLRFSLEGAAPSQAVGIVIAGPWPARLPDGPQAQVPLPLQADTRRSA